MHKAVAMLIACALVLSAPAALAQAVPGDYTDLGALRTASNADKRAVIAGALDLTPDEAKRFWPIYNSYQASLDMNNRRATLAVETLIARDKPVSDAYARNLVTELMSVEEANMRARRTLQNKVLKVLPAKKAARFMQVDNKIRAIEAYDIAAAIPLVK